MTPRPVWTVDAEEKHPMWRHSGSFQFFISRHLRFSFHVCFFGFSFFGLVCINSQTWGILVPYPYLTLWSSKDAQQNDQGKDDIGALWGDHLPTSSSGMDLPWTQIYHEILIVLPFDELCTIAFINHTLNTLKSKANEVSYLDSSLFVAVVAFYLNPEQ